MLAKVLGHVKNMLHAEIYLDNPFNFSTCFERWRFGVKKC